MKKIFNKRNVLIGLVIGILVQIFIMPIYREYERQRQLEQFANRLRETAYTVIAEREEKMRPIVGIEFKRE